MIIEFYKTNEWCSYYDEPSYSDEEWKEWRNEYFKYFADIKEKLPKGFVKQYYSNGGFHDFIISHISIQNSKPNRIIIEILLDGDYSGFGKVNNKILLTYRNVENYCINVPEGKQWFFNNMQWLSDEFYLREDGLWSHRIMCDGNCEIKLLFKKISIKKV